MYGIGGSYGCIKGSIAASATPSFCHPEGADSYGYEIIKQIKEVSDNEPSGPKACSILCCTGWRNGLVESYWRKSQAGRKHKYYRLKEAGLLELQEHRKQWELGMQSCHRRLRTMMKEGRIPMFDLEANVQSWSDYLRAGGVRGNGFT